jgi:predicted nucleic acid-binding protein
LIVDTGILYALVDRDDRYHRTAKRLFSSREPRIVPEPVVVETDWLLLEHVGVEAEIRFLQGVAATEFLVEPCTRADRARAAQLVALHRDARIGYVDAAVVAVAERLGERRIATIDRRYFAAIRPRHVDAFELVP